MELGLTGIFVVLFAISFAREPRRMRCAVFLLGAVGGLALRLVAAVGGAVTARFEFAGGWLLLGLLVVVAVMIVALAVMLVLNGLTMVRKEGRRLANLLSLLLGLGMLGGVVAVIALISTSVATDSALLVVVVLLASLPVAFLAYGFLAYLLYSAFYQAVTRRKPHRVAAVVALGSGLIDGRVPPLLASRLDAARRVFEDAGRAGTTPVLVTSGGQGDDESRAEADAMAEYLLEHGTPAGAILTEPESRTTGENLANTAALLAERGISGPVAVVTNNFHALRSAMMMRNAGVPGYVVGAPTAGYYWPSATIREYLAILRDHLWFVVVSVGLLSLPALWLAARALLG